jgi:hypothetical protein
VCVWFTDSRDAALCGAARTHGASEARHAHLACILAAGRPGRRGSSYGVCSVRGFQSKPRRRSVRCCAYAWRQRGSACPFGMRPCGGQARAACIGLLRLRCAWVPVKANTPRCATLHTHTWRQRGSTCPFGMHPCGGQARAAWIVLLRLRNGWDLGRAETPLGAVLRVRMAPARLDMPIWQVRARLGLASPKWLALLSTFPR